MKKWQRATGNELDSFLIRSNKVNTHPEFFNEIRDADGNIINPRGIKRANEMTGAGIEYATSLVEYVCTHHKDLIKKTDSDLYFETVPIEWRAALEIMTGSLAGQRSRAAKEILRLHAKPKPAIIKCKDGHFISMQPFVLAFDWGRLETLDARAAANLARMQKGAEKLAKKKAIETFKKEGRKIDIEYIEHPDLLPIEKITIQFSKPLFEDLMAKGGNTYSFPTGMYAKMFHFAQYQQKTLAMLKREIPDTYEQLDLVDTNEQHISAFARFARYIVRHNNLTANQMKNKDHCSTMNIKLIDMASEVCRSVINVNGRGEKRVDMRKMRQFLHKAINIYFSIEGWLFYPVIQRITSETMTLMVYTDVKKAENTLGIDPKTGNVLRKALTWTVSKDSKE